MNPDFEPNMFSVRLIDTETNETIGMTSWQDVDVKYKSNFHEQDYHFNRSYSVTLENASINYDALSNLFPSSDPTFTVICSTKLLNKLKYIHNHTKKKRIKNKISKRIAREFSHPAFNEGVSVRASDIELR